MYLNERIWDKNNLSNMNFNVWYETGMPMYPNHNTD